MILKGIARFGGDGWKDRTKKGEAVFVYSETLPSPYAPGQHARVGCIGWSASEQQFEFARASLWEIVRLLPKIIRDQRDRAHRRRHYRLGAP